MGTAQIGSRKSRPFWMNYHFTLFTPSALLPKSRDITIQKISTDVTMRAALIYYDLPPLYQTIVKILTMSAGKHSNKLPRDILRKVLNDMMPEGVDIAVLATAVDEMVKTFGLQFGEDHKVGLCFTVADVALELCTPDQIEKNW